MIKIKIEWALDGFNHSMVLKCKLSGYFYWPPVAAVMFSLGGFTVQKNGHVIR